MLSKEKLRIRLSLIIRNIFYHLIFWYIVLLFYIFLTGEDHMFLKYFGIIKTNSSYLATLYLSSALTCLFVTVEAFFGDRFFRFAPIRPVIVIRTISYIVLGFAILFFAPLSPEILLGITSLKDFFDLTPELNTMFFRFIVYFYLACFFNNFFQGMMKKVGKGNIRNWVFGMMNKPREEERIFMFIDMKSSTTIAEKLMHEKFSHLVQDIFNDMAIVDNYMGEIYQYLGDGAIISWSLKSGVKKNNFLKAFYSFEKVIAKREKYYQRKYGLVPKFKAGIHVGKVMVLQVGRIRRDISYNGDTLNTAARIESMCNEYKQNLLISGNLYDILREKDEFNFKTVGNIKLKGKRKGVDIYQVQQKALTK